MTTTFRRAALALAFVAPAVAQADDFKACDGFDTPSAKVDGMSRDTLLFGLATATVDKRADAFALGVDGIGACDRALGSPLLLPAYSLRRANLLEAKALHAAAAGQSAVALAALDQSDAAAANDPLFAVSGGLGNRAVRAFVLAGEGRGDAARAEIDRMVAARPWSASIRKLAYALRARIDEPVALATLRADLPLLPENAALLFWNAFALGEYQVALDYAPAISWDLPKKRGGWSFDRERLEGLEAIGERANVAGARAFALAATGRPAAAAPLLDDASADVAEALAEPPPRPSGEPPRKKDVAAWRERTPFAERARRDLDAWRTAIALLGEIGTKDPAAAVAAYQASAAHRLPIVPALLARMPTPTPQDRAERDATLAGYRANIATQRQKLLTFTPTKLVGQLPRPLTAKMMPTLKPAGDGYFLSDTGLSRAREGTSDVWTVRFVHKYAPIQVVEEMAMFGAAATALKEGKNSLLVLSRRSVMLSTQSYGQFGVYVGTFASGYEAQLRVALVDSAHLPPEHANQAGRLVPARAVFDDLSKRFRQSSGITAAW